MSELFTRTNNLFLRVLESSLAIILLTMIGSEFFHQFFLHIMSLNQEASVLAKMPGMFGHMCTSLLEFVTLTMLIPQRVMEIDANQAPGSFWAFTQKHVSALTLEGVRSLAVALFWLLLLIVPGVIKYIRYFFVPYVVVADPDYQAGGIDALAESERLTKGITWPLFFIILVLTGAEYCQQSVREAHPFLSAPLVSALATVGFFAFNYYMNIWLFVLYQYRLKRMPR